MAPRRPNRRHFNRNSAHRFAMLRNLLTSLFLEESITTTYAKAKETQRLADKCVTMAKKGTNAARIRAQQIFYKPEVIPKLFGEIAQRYAQRPGGYTRVLPIEPRDKADQAPSAILELVDGPKDIRFTMTAKTIARCQANNWTLNDLTLRNIKKVTQFRSNGETELEKMVKKLREMKV